MINPDAKDRLNIKEVLEHEWFDILKEDSTDDSIEENDQSILKTLTDFSNQSKFMKACMKILTNNIKIRCNFEVRSDFMKIDEKQNAMISKDELRNAFDKANVSISDKEIIDIISDINFSGDRHINYTEFCMATMEKADLLNSKNIKTLFKIFDSDSDGKISQNDITKELEKSGCFSKNTIKRVIKDSGMEKNSKYGVEEFENILLSS